jgi:uncharacterized protein
VEDSLATTLPTKPQRDQVPEGKSLCDFCTAKCCRYFAMPLDAPTEVKDFDYIRWYLLHDRATVFVEDGTWYLLVHTTCKHLQSDNRCGIYFTRPQICRDYTTDECEYDDSWCYEQYFETPEQIVEYVEARFGPQPDQFPVGHPPGTSSIRSPKPQGLPVL